MLKSEYIVIELLRNFICGIDRKKNIGCNYQKQFIRHLKSSQTGHLVSMKVWRYALSIAFRYIFYWYYSFVSTNCHCVRKNFKALTKKTIMTPQVSRSYAQSTYLRYFSSLLHLFRIYLRRIFAFHSSGFETIIRTKIKIRHNTPFPSKLGMQRKFWLRKLRMHVI